MRTQDAMKLKGDMKDALVKWCDCKIDEMLPDMHKTRALVKNGVNNWIARKDSQINGYLDAAMLMISDESGIIDSDSLIDAAADILDEIPSSEFGAGLFTVTVGKGEIVLGFPSGPVGRIMFGDRQGVRLTRKDIGEIKNLINSI